MRLMQFASLWLLHVNSFCMQPKLGLGLRHHCFALAQLLLWLLLKNSSSQGIKQGLGHKRGWRGITHHTAKQRIQHPNRWCDTVQKLSYNASALQDER
jgi:hypothetical protein